LVLLENRREAVLSVKDERVLHNNYDLHCSAQLQFQDPTTRTINGEEVTLFERMFMANLRLPFSEIAWELLLFLMIALS
jgi:hypothetical protein